jgi:hypothetical protein
MREPLGDTSGKKLISYAFHFLYCTLLLAVLGLVHLSDPNPSLGLVRMHTLSRLEAITRYLEQYAHICSSELTPLFHSPL